jgi:hypothetical protein
MRAAQARDASVTRPTPLQHRAGAACCRRWRRVPAARRLRSAVEGAGVPWSGVEASRHSGRRPLVTSPKSQSPLVVRAHARTHSRAARAARRRAAGWNARARARACVRPSCRTVTRHRRHLAATDGRSRADCETASVVVCAAQRGLASAAHPWALLRACLVRAHAFGAGAQGTARGVRVLRRRGAPSHTRAPQRVPVPPRRCLQPVVRCQHHGAQLRPPGRPHIKARFTKSLNRRG